MGWQSNLVDSALEWTSSRTGVLWRVEQNEAKHWVATFNGVFLRLKDGAIVPHGRRSWWRTSERAREACELHDARMARTQPKKVG